MSLKAQIDLDFVEAMKTRRERELAILRILKSAVKNTEIEKRTELDDQGIVEVIRREVKKLKDGLLQFESGGRADLVDAAKAEIAVLEKYLPAAPSEEEIAVVVQSVIAAVGAQGPADTGKVTGLAMKELKGRADGAAVRAVVEKCLRG